MMTKKMNGTKPKAKPKATIPSFAPPMDSIKVSPLEQKRLLKPEAELKKLHQAAGRIALDAQTALTNINASIGKLQQEQAMIGEDVLRSHGKDPTEGQWVYNSDQKVIERRA